MTKSFCLLCLTIISLTHSPLVDAVPLTSTFDYDDIDEVIEVPSNYLEVEDDKSTKDIIDLSSFGETLFGTPDIETTAQLVGNYTTESNVNPEELGSYLEGDILIPTEKFNAGRAFSTKNGIETQSSRWPGAIVPFEIRGNFLPNERATIQHAMDEYHRRTCIRFVPRTREPDYISIVSGSSGCWSSVGRVGGKQEVNLQAPGCLGKPGTPIHELMHAIGFLHEQNREERDGFVSIQYQNIQQQAVPNFEKASRTLAFGVPYDYASVMHYSANAFSSNGRPTIVAVQPGGSSQMGQRNGFSAFDVEKLNKMYECKNFGGVPSVPNGNGNVGAPVLPPVPAPPVPAGGGGAGGIIGNFLGGLISGLGLGEEQTLTNSTTAEKDQQTSSN